MNEEIGWQMLYLMAQMQLCLAETSVGKFPSVVIQTSQILAAVEHDGNIYYKDHPPVVKNKTLF